MRSIKNNKIVKKSLCIFSLCFFLLAGCATTKEKRIRFEHTLQSWVGSNISDLIIEWGPPSRTFYLPDGRKVYIWNFNKGTLALPVWGQGWGYVYTTSLFCQIKFIVDENGIIQSWGYRGNKCY